MIGKNTKKVALFLDKELAEALEEFVKGLNKNPKKKVTKSSFISWLFRTYLESCANYVEQEQNKDKEKAKEENLDA